MNWPKILTHRLSQNISVPWRQIKGMRDKVAHGYGTIDMDRVWDTVLNDINPLLKYCKEILEKNISINLINEAKVQSQSS